ncbi:MAG: hypothetical protein IJI21_04810 [Clostridia bacterium]|nr:hypothetical protein [Clostridia bacterium]
MRKWIAWMMIGICVLGMEASAWAETGFENLYGLYCDEQVLGEPWAVYEMAEDAQAEKICLAIFLFDPDNDMTQAVLIGADAEGLNRYYTWTTGYENGVMIMGFLVSRFAELKDMCNDGVDFCVSFSFDGGETMTDISTVEAAEQLAAILQQDTADMESADVTEGA